MASKLRTNYLPELFALGIRRSKPGMVTVNLTTLCNQRCIYCEIGKDIPSKVKEALTLDDLRWIIDQMSINKIPKISLCGGEPFLFDGLFDAIAYAGEKDIRCSITSNGMTVHLLEGKDLDLLKAYKTEINISIDSFDASVQSITRGTTVALSNALKSIKVLNENHIPVTMLTVISIYNFRNLSEIFAIAFEKGIKQVLFQPVIFYSNYPDRQAIDNKSGLNVGIDQLDILMTELEKILHFERSHRIKTNVYRLYPWIRFYLESANLSGERFFKKALKKFYCREIDAIIDIAYDGGIQPCGLVLADINIRENRHLGLMAMWLVATQDLRNDLQYERYPDCCDACCHHFSRNMLASIMKYPLQNRRILIRMLPLILKRLVAKMSKRL